ncbi:DoxX family protein [Actinokineospora auranticolor]|uniref:Putative membrane protein YphA (DoxX/SURF4 family) n=1 Tax=Actinokineospora auranticolor TaxID=155976 RepID=A0A2S6H0L7_9PSEU|nr:DoxX family protein [Actinokineospora auranticolor]PPK70957.1 putative membrane protein YphA (DoxX/SURF4 family) [Actinokineospora auranticolor]
MILRRLARPMLAAIFISGGINALRSAEAHAEAAKPLLDPLAERYGDKLPGQVPTDPVTLVRIDGAVKVGAGIALALGKFPRLAALALSGSLVPTTLAAHRFWEEKDPAVRQQQQIHFVKNVSLLGGLLIAAVDTHGKPSVAWRARRAGHDLGDWISDTGGHVGHAVAVAPRKARKAVVGVLPG